MSSNLSDPSFCFRLMIVGRRGNKRFCQMFGQKKRTIKVLIVHSPCTSVNKKTDHGCHPAKFVSSFETKKSFRLFKDFLSDDSIDYRLRTTFQFLRMKSERTTTGFFLAPLVATAVFPYSNQVREFASHFSIDHSLTSFPAVTRWPMLKQCAPMLLAVM